MTSEVQRYVYVYLLTGEKCCLSDAGVAGSEAVISAYMKKLGRDISENRDRSWIEEKCKKEELQPFEINDEVFNNLDSSTQLLLDSLLKC